MARPKRAYSLTTKFAKCGSKELRRTELSMYGKLGFLGPDYRFDVYICKNCGHTELFFQKASWIM